MGTVQAKVTKQGVRLSVAISTNGDTDVTSLNHLTLATQYVYIVLGVVTDTAGQNRFVEEIHGLTDLSVLGVEKPFAESLGTVDEVNEIIFGKGLEEDLPTSESWIFDTTKELSDVVQTTDDFMGTANLDDDQVVAFAKAMTDEQLVSTDDAIASVGKNLADPVGTADLLGFDTGKLLVDEGILDDVQEIVFTKEVNDSVDAGDEFNAVALTDDGEIMIFGKSLHEAFTQVDEISVQPEKSVTDELVAVDEIVDIQKGKGFEEVATTFESYSFDSAKPLDDAFSATDSTLVSFGSVFKDYPSIGDGPYYKPTYAIDYFAEEYALEGFPMIVLTKGFNDTVHTTDDFLGVANADDDETMSFGKVWSDLAFTADQIRYTGIKGLTDVVSTSGANTFSLGKQLADLVGKSDITVKGTTKKLVDATTTLSIAHCSAGKGLSDTAATAEYNLFAIQKKLADTVHTTDDFLGNANADDDETMLLNKVISDSFTKSDSVSIGPGKGLADAASTSESGSIIWTDYWPLDYTDTSSGMFVGNQRTF